MNPKKPKYTKERTIRNFMDKVYPEPNTGCWLWSGQCHPSGHGTVKNTAHDGFYKAHRYSYYVANGDFDRTLCVLHKCDNPHCVNPDHLYLGTHQQNMKDMVDRKRIPDRRGSKCVNAKLTEEQVLEIRRTFKTRSKEFGSDALAMKFGVGRSNINNILCRLSWTHI